MGFEVIVFSTLKVMRQLISLVLGSCVLFVSRGLDCLVRQRCKARQSRAVR